MVNATCWPLLAATAAANVALISFAGYLVAVIALAWLSSRASGKGTFVSEYFLGSRNLGVWAFALTFAATSASGGSFVGFPAYIYTHGWVLALWIAGYMLVPLVAMGLLGKRLNHVSRRAGAITIPEVLAERFASPWVGMLATLLIVVFIFFYLLAQFKAGSKILASLLDGVYAYEVAVRWMGHVVHRVGWLHQAEPDYLLCLLVFAVAVIGYVVYGGFRAVVWTDVMQGVVMFLGVIILLVLALHQTGGLGAATRRLARQVPPVPAVAELVRPSTETGPMIVPKGEWFRHEGQLVRIAEQAVFAAGSEVSSELDVLLIEPTRENALPDPALVREDLHVSLLKQREYAYGASRPGGYVTAPGPHPTQAYGFLTLGVAFSFFSYWTFSGAGQPSNMVRLMAFRDTRTLKRAIVTVSLYFSFIYFSLVVVFCSARLLLPAMEIDPDRVMPEMAVQTTTTAGIPWLAGILLAAPFAAVMSSVDSFLLLVSSSLVRDIYQRFLKPDANEQQVKRITYAGTVLIGVAATLWAIHPAEYLQNLIVFAGGGLSACFLVPMAFALYWRRMTATGAMAGMLGGCVTHFLFTYGPGEQLVIRTGLEAFLWDLVGSCACVVIGSLLTRPPDQALVARYFDS